jgi:B9 domain-containing protein 1
LGRDEIKGYGCAHLPVTPGNHLVDVHMFVPEPASRIQKLINWVLGTYPEYIDPKFIAQGEGRELTRVSSQGVVYLNVNVVTKDLKKQGFKYDRLIKDENYFL